MAHKFRYFGLALGRLRQEDCCDEANLNYPVNPRLATQGYTARKQNKNISAPK